MGKEVEGLIEGWRRGDGCRGVGTGMVEGRGGEEEGMREGWRKREG